MTAATTTPSGPSKLIRSALRDLEILEDERRGGPLKHGECPLHEKCQFCLGVVLLGKLLRPKPEQVPELDLDYSAAEEFMLAICNRAGEGRACRELGIEFREILDRVLLPLRADPTELRRQLEQLACRLEVAGH
jgi:hypothetical protein